MPHRWNALVRQVCMDERVPSALRGQWRRYFKKSLATLKSPEEVHQHVNHFHAQPTFDKSSLKMFFAVDPIFETTWAEPSVLDDQVSLTSAGDLCKSKRLSCLLEETMMAIKAERKFGAAPKADLERQILAMLDKRSSEL